MVNKPIIRLYFWGGSLGGVGWLAIKFEYTFVHLPWNSETQTNTWCQIPSFFIRYTRCCTRMSWSTQNAMKKLESIRFKADFRVPCWEHNQLWGWKFQGDRTQPANVLRVHHTTSTSSDNNNNNNNNNNHHHHHHHHDDPTWHQNAWNIHHSPPSKSRFQTKMHDDDPVWRQNVWNLQSPSRATLGYKTKNTAIPDNKKSMKRPLCSANDPRWHSFLFTPSVCNSTLLYLTAVHYTLLHFALLYSVPLYSPLLYSALLYCLEVYYRKFLTKTWSLDNICFIFHILFARAWVYFGYASLLQCHQRNFQLAASQAPW